MDDKEMLIAKSFVEKSEDIEGVLEASVASTSIVDREGEIISQDGWDLKNFKKNPVFLWAHNMRDVRPPIGKVSRTWFDGEGKSKRLMFKTEFDMADPFAADIYRKYKEGFLSSFSVGFLPVEREGVVYTKAELLEISAVPVPANPQANIFLRSKGFEPMSWKDIVNEEHKRHEDEENKAVIPFTATPTLAESNDWDINAAKGRVKDWAKDDISQYGKAFAWKDLSEKDALASYKLPHHDVMNGSLHTVWRGVASAMAALLGAGGGIDVPEEDKKGVYNHLKKHYSQFDKEAPDYRYVEEQVLKGFSNEVTAFIDERVEEELKEITEIVRDLKLRLDAKKASLQNVDVERLKDALRIVNQSTAIALKNLKLKGGEK